VGLGLSAKGLTIEGVEELKNADAVYLEYYTTPHEPQLVRHVQAVTGKRLTIVDRGFVEDGNSILADAKERNVVLAVLGDPMIATTHTELRVRAIRQGIETRVIHSATIVSAAASASGLHSYKFSRTVTVTRESVGKLTQAYHLLHENLLEGAHTLLLMEYDVQSGEGAAGRGELQAGGGEREHLRDPAVEAGEGRRGYGCRELLRAFQERGWGPATQPGDPREAALHRGGGDLGDIRDEGA
jgi:diphthine synthase